MKTIANLISSFLCSSVFLFSLVGCDDKTVSFENKEDVSFSDYFLNNSYQWANLKYDNKEVITINNKSELGNYITCAGAGEDLPEIDFSTHSLLLTSGGTTSGITIIGKQLKEVASNRYELDIDITLDMTTHAPRWVVAILTPKIPHNANVVLNVSQHH
jgi:hypothetical protein